jgi:cyclase
LQVPAAAPAWDFYCHKVKLVVEIDGSIHNEPEVIERDKLRQKDLENWGYKIIRFTNNQVMMNIGLVITEISNAVKSRLVV